MKTHPVISPGSAKGLGRALAVLFIITWPLTTAAAADFNQVLSESEVACDEMQLARLLERMSGGYAVYHSDQIARTTFVTYSNSVGFYEGLVVNNQWWHFGSFLPQAPPETYLAFHINPSIRPLLLNPSRPQLGQVALVREEPGSNIIEPHPFLRIDLSLNPTLGTGGVGALVINNIRAPAVHDESESGVSSSVKPGRGLSMDGLLDSCHGKFSDFDRHIFAILPRIIRPVIANQAAFLEDTEVSVFRGRQVNSYRLNVYGIENAGAPPMARVALELTVEWNESGQLTTGVLRILPACAPGQSLGCTQGGTTEGGVLVIPPILGGTTIWSTGDPRVRHVSYFQNEPGAPAQIDFTALLGESTWNSFQP